MGTYYSSHIGCFLKIPRTNVPVTETYFELPSGRRAKSRFNPETGKEYPQVTKTTNQVREVNGWIEDRDDIGEGDSFMVAKYSSTTEAYTILIPNSDSELCKMDTEWSYSCSLLNINVENEILKFKRKYSKVLDYYTEKYGKYEIDFGIVRDGN